MKKRYFIFLTATLLLLLSSCFRENFETAGTLLSTDKETVVVSADIPGLADISDSIKISANRSWSAYLEPQADWLNLSTYEFENIARSSETQNVVLSFLNNETKQDRSVTLHITTAESHHVVTVTQKAQVPYIKLVTPSEVSDVTCEPDTVQVIFESNVCWTASIDPSSTASAKLDKKQGKYSDTLTVYFEENDDTFEKYAVLKLKTADGSGIEQSVNFTQSKSAPYIKWVSKDADYKTSESGSLTLNFKTNSSWTAAFLQTVQGIALLSDSGTKADKSIEVCFGEYQGPGRIRQATLRLSIPTGSYIDMDVRQIANAIFVDFKNGNQPFDKQIPHNSKYGEVMKILVTNTPTEYLYTIDGTSYPFTFYSGEGYGLLDGNSGNSCGIIWQPTKKVEQGAWIKLPSIEGKKLVTVKALASNMSTSATKNFIISKVQPTSTASPAKADIMGSSAALKATYAVINLSSPVVSTSYYMVAGNTSIYFSELYLIYE